MRTALSAIFLAALLGLTGCRCGVPELEDEDAGESEPDAGAADGGASCTPSCTGIACGNPDGCGGTCVAPSACTDPLVEPPLITTPFNATNDELLNPERGFYDGVDLVNGASFAFVRTNGRTLAYAGVRLDAFRTQPLNAALLTALENGFVRARTAGIKLVLRFVYNDCLCADATKAQILEHISQLRPVIARNADVIAVWQAGFIGAWGEWHTSTNGLDNPTDRKEILDALLAALPASRMTQIRTPHFKFDAYGAALLPEEAFSGSNKARTGHQNDCFLASNSDQGTYQSPIETWKDHIAQDCRYTPMGGETCALNAPRIDCPTATSEMARLHWSFLNALYHQSVIGAWNTQGCLPEIKQRLGYRLSIIEASWSQQTRPGGVLALEVKIRNGGYAALYNPRRVYAVLHDGTNRRVALLSAVDPRRWEPEETSTFTVRLRMPADVAAGSHSLTLWLPDDAVSLRQNVAYSVQLANAGTWNATLGENTLTNALVVDALTTGAVDPTATAFVELP